MPEDEQTVFAISRIAKMLHVHPQTLRFYEHAGFVKPVRITACTHRLHKASMLVETERLRVHVQHLGNTTNGKNRLLVFWHTLSLALRSLSYWSVIPVWG